MHLFTPQHPGLMAGAGGVPLRLYFLWPGYVDHLLFYSRIWLWFAFVFITSPVMEGALGHSGEGSEGHSWEKKNVTSPWQPDLQVSGDSSEGRPGMAFALVHTAITHYQRLGAETTHIYSSQFWSLEVSSRTEKGLRGLCSHIAGSLASSCKSTNPIMRAPLSWSPHLQTPSLWDYDFDTEILGKDTFGLLLLSSRHLWSRWHCHTWGQALISASGSK